MATFRTPIPQNLSSRWDVKTWARTQIGRPVLLEDDEDHDYIIDIFTRPNSKGFCERIGHIDLFNKTMSVTT